ncbi:MAG: nucleoside recognition protein [Clostridia bacterium]|nr:nucleoside recognition protein [Clostridia bacterium]
MLNYIWVGMILIGFTVGIFNGRIDAVTQAAMGSAKNAVELCVGLLGIMCLWTGLMSIAEKSGLIQYISKIVRPAMAFLFPGIPCKHPALGSVVMNLVANFLGLGNAATPLGLKAMSELQKINPNKDTASNAMCMFLVLNTSAVQLVPATVIAIRHQYNSANASEIIGTVWIASACAMTVGIIAAKIFSSASRRDGICR